MKIIDCHAHLQAAQFNEILKDEIDAAQKKGVSAIINAATEPDDWNRCRKISAENACVKLSLGIHPWYIPQNHREFLSALDEADFAECVSIGEIGLDGKYSRHSMETQTDVFRFFIKAADYLEIPAVVHCISAFDEMLKILKNEKIKIPIVIHAFSGSAEQARQLSRRNIFFSMGGLLTGDRSPRRDKLVKFTYPELMLLETDAPDFLPRGVQGKFNRPENILHNLKAAADILSIDSGEVAENLFALSRKVFSL